jgi:hypothetical protein
MPLDPREGPNAPLFKAALMICLVLGVIEGIASVVGILLIIAGLVVGVAAVVWLVAWFMERIRGPPPS